MCRPPTRSEVVGKRSLVETVQEWDEKIGKGIYDASKRCHISARCGLELMSIFGDECLSFPATVLIFIIAFTMSGHSVWTALAAEVFGDLGLLCFIEQICKLTTKRTRPKYAPQGSFYVLYGEVFSCPSGHTMRAFFLAASFLMSPRLVRKSVPNALPLILALGTGLARVAKGRHYPSDCIAGAMLGIAIAILAARLGPSAWATTKYPFGIAMTIEAISVSFLPTYRTKGFAIHLAIAALWCFSTRLGFGAWRSHSVVLF